MATRECRTAWGARVLGLAVLGLVLGLALAFGLGGGAPAWTWIVLAAFGLASLHATVANFGDLVRVDDDGLHYENTLTGRLGWPRTRRVPWTAVMAASEYEGRTWFLEIEGQRRWVLDQLSAHDELKLVFESRGVPVREVRKPRPWTRRSDEPR